MMPDDEVVIGSSSKRLSILFSHNINGETHPCGCRHHPLGGLTQVAGKMHQLGKDSAGLIYIDTGDTFFPSSKIPKTVESSTKFIARQLAWALDQQGLKFYLPGDQDFAAGAEFLKELGIENGFQFVIANLKDESRKSFPSIQSK